MHADSRRRGVYEPIHGSAPNIAGKGLANPGQARSSSLALLFRLFATMRGYCPRTIEAAVAEWIRPLRFGAPDIAEPGFM